MSIDKVLKVEDIVNLSTDVLIEAVRNGYKLEDISSMYKDFISVTDLNDIISSQNISNVNDSNSFSFVESLASCPSSIVQGTTKTITVQASGGTPPYKFEFIVDAVTERTWSNSSTSPQSWSRTFNDAVGSHTFQLLVGDSCTARQVPEEQKCFINVTAPTATVSSISIPPSLSVSVGQKVNLVVCKNSAGSNVTCPSISWSRSSSCCVNLYTDGTVEGVAVGSLTVRPYDSVSGSQGNVCTVTVTQPSALASMTAPPSLTISVGQTRSAGVVCKNSSGSVISCPSLSWSRSSNCCVDLYSTGNVKGNEEGSLNVRPYDSVTGIYSNVISVNVTPLQWSGWSSSIGGGSYDSPNLVVFNNRLYTVVSGKGSPYALFINSMGTNGVWSGWNTSIGGYANTSPGLAVFNNRLYAIVAGTDYRIWLASMNINGLWSGWSSSMGGGSYNSPNLVVFNNRLYAVVSGKGYPNDIYINSMGTDGVWSGWNTSIGGKSYTSPGLAVFNNRLYAITSGIDYKIWTASMGTNGIWSGWSNLIGGGSYDSPRLASFNNRLYAVVSGKGSPYDIYINSMGTNGVWKGWNTSIGGKSYTSPGLAVFNNKLYSIVTGTDYKIYFNSSI
ncbi:MAG: hypothetical protein PHP08_00330 [Candidatus Dojkabacteria bacterium]|nr:hypothetical protein [Candidatus Dojkabacteria bacterium]